LSAARFAAAAALAGLALAPACMSEGDFRCTTHAQCAVGDRDGFCEGNGHCSVTDEEGCAPSHRRYVHRAGSDSDACVPASCEADPITSVAAGGGHACLVHAEGSLWCWGRNDHGQLGDGTRTPRALPVRVGTIDKVAAVATGEAHTCAVTTAGAVLCWGADDTGQLGDGGDIDRGVPREVTGITGATAAAAGKNFSCAVGGDRAVRCWGDGKVGQLGDGGALGPRPPTIVAGAPDVDSLSASGQHACAVTTSGRVLCWGANDKGQIGDGTLASARPPTSPDPVALPPATRVTKVVTGDAHTCALASDGLRCWGDNSQDQIDPALPSAPVTSPIAVGTDPIDVAAGAQHTCIVRKGATENPVTCWGANSDGQRGGETPMPQVIANATAVAAGGAFSCALATDGALYCWGDNHFGQLAIGGDTARATPVQVPGLAHAAALAAGGAHTCATADDADGAKALFCWGANDSGQLGDGSLDDAPAPARVSSLQLSGLAAGAAHTCAIGADRQLRCWGWGAAGQLGQEAGIDMVITVPTATDLVPPEGGDGVFAVAGGAEHTCVGATVSVSVLCFGRNVDGQLGNGLLGDVGGPDKVAALRGKPSALTAGGAHTCAIDDEGDVWCWGRGDEGQLGDGLGVEHASPTSVALGTDSPAEAITAGAAHTCVLAGGRVRCWGRNADGQLGAPLPAPLLAPRLVTKLAQARAVAAGGRHTCAIGDDATVSCWGANESGQLGNGSFDPSNIPVPVAGLTNVEAIVGGGAHSCARRADGTIWCWGANTSGQLGDGVTLVSPRPLLARVVCE
jgi:alpha-tubulin suppressor-like RCC1 family protein